MTASHHPARINLKLREIVQLFNSMDPSPFLERDLDDDAEEFIVSWARELPRHHSLELAIHLAKPEPQSAVDVQDAVQHYFASRADIKRREFRQLLKRGHVSLLIGLVFLTVCLFASGMVGKVGHDSIAGVMREGLIIIGWVAMWRPLEIYLYDWWSVRDEWRILQRLARIHVRLILPRGSDATLHAPPPPAALASNP